MGVVGGHQGNAGLAGQAHHALIHLFLDLQALVLHLEEEVALAENIAQAIGRGARGFFPILQQAFGDFSTQTGGEGNQATGMLGEQVVVHARLVVKAGQTSRGDQFDQVAVALGILAQQYQVVGAAGSGSFRIGRLLLVTAASHVNLAADDRFDAARGGFVEKIGRGEQVAVVGDGHGGHAAARSLIYDRSDVTGAVQKTVVSVQMEMDKIRSVHSGSHCMTLPRNLPTRRGAASRCCGCQGTMTTAPRRLQRFRAGFFAERGAAFFPAAAGWPLAVTFAGGAPPTFFCAARAGLPLKAVAEGAPFPGFASGFPFSFSALSFFLSILMPARLRRTLSKSSGPRTRPASCWLKKPSSTWSNFGPRGTPRASSCAAGNDMRRGFHRVR